MTATGGFFARSVRLASQPVFALWRERCEVLAAVREGLEDAAAGRVRPYEEVIEELRALHRSAPAR